MNEFNPNKDMRPQRIKAHVTYTKKNKKKDMAMKDANRDGFDCCLRPSEFDLIPNLQQGDKKPLLTKEKLFDTKNDGKPFPKKKESKIAKMARAFYMINGDKQFHQI